MKVQRIEKERTDILKWLRSAFKSVSTRYYFSLTSSCYHWYVTVKIIREDNVFNHLDVHKYYAFRDTVRMKNYRISQWELTHEDNHFVMSFKLRNLDL